MGRQVLKNFCLILLLFISVLSGSESFGRNKVQFGNDSWLFTKTENFIVYYPESSDSDYIWVDFACSVLESTYTEYSAIFSHKIKEEVPVVLYPTTGRFGQTNITMQILPESGGGFTELLRRRVVLPFNGSYKDFRHVLRHELVHSFQFDILYDPGLSSYLSPNRYIDVPLELQKTSGIISSVTMRIGYVLSDICFYDRAYPLEYLGGISL